MLDYLIIADVICVYDLSFLSLYNEYKPIHIITCTRALTDIYPL